MRERSLLQPLVTRPAYGEGHGPVAQSGLPDGGPGSKGVPLDPRIPGSSTHDKPEEAIRKPDENKQESIYRTDNADDLLTIGDGPIPVKEENANKHDGIGGYGKGKWDERSPKTKYPYRDGIPNTHSASEYVLARWEADQAPIIRVFSGVRTKIAINRDSILDGLNPKVTQRSKKCAVSLRRADIKNLRWILGVDCGNGPRVVKLKASRSGNLTKLSKMDMDLSCSCPAWRWLGSEHHSQREEYLDGKPRGTASVPVIKDPQGINRVCKHVAAVLDHVAGWDVARKKR